MLHKQHGISSALLMTTVRALFRERILSPGSTASIVSDVNKRLVRDIEALNLFITIDILKEVIKALDDFRFPVERKDDETLVVIKIP